MADSWVDIPTILYASSFDYLIYFSSFILVACGCLSVLVLACFWVSFLVGSVLAVFSLGVRWWFCFGSLWGLRGCFPAWFALLFFAGFSFFPSLVI